MKTYGVMITYFEKTEHGQLIPHTESMVGSKTSIFNAISDVLKRGNFENVTVILKEQNDAV